MSQKIQNKNAIFIKTSGRPFFYPNIIPCEEARKFKFTEINITTYRARKH